MRLMKCHGHNQFLNLGEENCPEEGTRFRRSEPGAVPRLHRHLELDRRRGDLRRICDHCPNSPRWKWWKRCTRSRKKSPTMEPRLARPRRGVKSFTRCFLRQKRVSEAKPLFRTVFRKWNQISSPGTRNLLQKRIIERIEEESVLTSLIGFNEGPLKPDRIHEEAIKLIQMPEGELLELLARALPYEFITLLNDVRTDAYLQFSTPDRTLLPAPGQATGAPHVGKLVLAVLKRVGWKTLCDRKSPLYKLWSEKVSTVYSAAYFATSIAQTCQDWKIGVQLLAAGVTAIAMKYGAQEFCELTRPDSTMDSRRKKEPKKLG